MLTQTTLINRKVPWSKDVKNVKVDFPAYISQLLLSNSPPTEEELPLVAGYLGEAIEALVQFQENSRSVDQGEPAAFPQADQTAQIESPSLLSITKQIDAARIILSPVRRLPAEIITEIVSLCCFEHADLDAPLAARFPMLACRVSSQWRHSIESYSRLWSRIRFNPGVGYNQPYFDLTMEKYGKLATTPIHLDLLLSQPYQSRQEIEDIAPRTLYILTEWPGRSQISSLSIDFSARPALDRFIDLVGTMRFPPFPNLRILSFAAPNSGLTTFKQIFRNAPNVVQLYLEGNNASPSEFSVLPQTMTQNLADLEMQGCPLGDEQWMLLMLGCRKLQRASFDLYGKSHKFQQLTQVAELPELLALQLNFLSTCQLNPLLPLRWLILPQLTSLTVHLHSSYLPPLGVQTPYKPKLPRLAHLSILANIPRGMWRVDDDGQAHPNSHSQVLASTEGIEVTVYQMLSLAQKNLLSLHLSFSAPLPFWEDIFRVWMRIPRTTGVHSDHGRLPSMKSLHIGIPAEVIIRGCCVSLGQLVERLIQDRFCKLEYLKVSIGLEKQENMDKANRAIDALRKVLDVYVRSDKLVWEHDILEYQPAGHYS